MNKVEFVMQTLAAQRNEALDQLVVAKAEIAALQELLDKAKEVTKDAAGTPPATGPV